MLAWRLVQSPEACRQRVSSEGWNAFDNSWRFAQLCFKEASQWENMVLEEVEKDLLPAGRQVVVKVAVAG